MNNTIVGMDQLTVWVHIHIHCVDTSLLLCDISENSVIL